jgi:hypothetical protein
MIRFINHASFVVEAGGISLLCDPWIEGSAFHNGWNLLTEQEHAGLDEVDYIWFSHEHPDHFSVPFLRTIPPERRPAITVLYQETPDRRVLSFCERLGFKVRELAHAEPVRLGPQLRITCGKIPFYDSWLEIETADYRILNTNDCILESPTRLGYIRPHVQNCDILFTQFSYANWQDSRDNRQARRDLAAEKLRRIALQCEMFKPEFVVPFASFSYFSHVENAFMNADINRAADAVRFIEENCLAAPVLLIPNECWDGLSRHDNRPAMDWWERAYFDAMSREKNQSGPSVSFVDMCLKADAAIRRVKQRNNFALVTGLQRLGVIKKVEFHLTDTGQSVSFDWISGLRLLDAPPFRAIEMHSESLAFIFDNDFGVDTVNVNARFEGSIRDKKQMIGLFSILELNNTGRALRFSESLKFVNPALLEQGLRTIGVIRR